jgi:hypothetical protein
MENGEVCFAYRNSTGTGLVVGFRAPLSTSLMTIDLRPQDFFYIVKTTTNCHLIVALQLASEFYEIFVYKDNILQPGSLLTAQTKVFAMSATIDMRSTSSILFGLAFDSNSNGPSLALFTYDYDTNEYDDKTYPLLQLTGVTDAYVVQDFNLHQLREAPQNLSVVVQTATAGIWLGSVQMPNQTFYAHSFMTPNTAIKMTSRVVNATFGVICFRNTPQTANVRCQAWDPSTSLANKVFVSETSAAHALGLLNTNATVLLAESYETTTAVILYYLKDGELPLSADAIGHDLSANVEYAVSDANEANQLTLIIGDKTSGDVQLIKILHAYCGDGIVNNNVSRILSERDYPGRTLTCGKCRKFVMAVSTARVIAHSLVDPL